QPASRPRQQSPAPVATAAVSAPSLAVGDDEYRVGSGDTVWAIAEKIRPQGASMAQTMAAIKQANPQSFINDNINLLKKGAVLRLPEGSDIAALSDVNYSDLVGEGVATDDSQAPMLDATPADTETAVAAATGEGRLKLAALGADEALTPDVAGVNGAEEGGASVAGTGADALAVAREELDKSSRENAELRDRVAQLEEQLSTMNRLVEIQDDSLRGSQVATQVEAEPTPAADSASVAAEPAADEATPAAAADVAPEKEKGFDLAAWVDYLLYPAIALLALLLAALMFFRNRKQDEDEVDELSLQSLVDKPTAEALPEEEEPLLSEDDKHYIAELAEELDDEGLQDLEDLEELQLGDDEGVDPKGEADIYLSLGNYRQAENILKAAIEADPQDSSLQLKLLEVYVSADNLAAFDQQRAQLATLNNPEADARASTLRAELISDVSGDADAESAETTVATEADDLAVEAPQDQVDFEAPSLDYDLGDVEPEQASALTDESTAASQLESVDLELPETEAEPEPPAPAPAQAAEAAGQDFDLDLDLSDIDLDSLASEIDQDMSGIELDESAQAPVPESPDAGELSVSNERYSAPESLPEQSFEELEDAILSGSETGEDDNYDLDAELKAFGDEDVCDTKLVLAETYLDLGDADNARDLLSEVLEEGTEEQKEKARNLLETVT
ncbi:FimV/HubP family polar landmark protein, partial [Porticoccus sp.]